MSGALARVVASMAIHITMILIGDGDHGHGGQKQQHGAGEDGFRLDVRRFEVSDGVYGDEEEEQRYHQQRK